MERDLLGFVAGFVIATITSPVGVSGAVFLLPVQLSVFGVPNPQVTPTNLLYNVLSESPLRAPAVERGGVHRPGLVTRHRVRPRWVVWGALGASLQRRMPEKLLRTMLGLLALGLAVLYAAQAAI